MSNKVDTTDMKQETKRELKPKLRFPEFRGKGEWSQYFGNEVFEQINNKQYDSSLPVLAITQEHGAIPRDSIDYRVFVTEKSLESYKVVDVGDFIISLRSFQGGIEYSGYKGVCSPAYIILRKKTDASEAYFKQFFKTERFVQELNKNIEGLRDGKMVSYKQFSELLLPIPSVDEQQKIADCLSSLDELIAAQNQKLDTLKAHKKGLMQQLFPAEGEILPQLRFPEFQSNWQEKKLSNCIELISGLHLSPNEYGRAGKIPYFTGPSDFTNSNSGNEKWTEGSSNNANTNDILITVKGSGVGELWYLTLPCVAMGRQLMAIRSKGCSSQFIYQFLATKRKRFEALGSGNLIPGISRKDILDMSLSIPSLTEQQKIADCLSSLDELIAAQSKKLDVLKTYKKGLLQQLFPTPDGVE